MIRRLLFLASIALLCTLPASARAQSAVSLSSLTISLWPEYDREAVLVIYQAQLASTVDLPAQIPLPIPAAVGSPHAVANATGQGGLVNAPYDTSTQGQWMTVTVASESPTVWLEYYDELAISGRERDFTFHWPGTLPVEQFFYEIKQPPGASDFQIMPAPTGQRSDQEGLTYVTGSLGPLAAGENAQIEVSYRRSTDALTVDLLGSAPPALESPADQPPASSPPWPYFAGGAGLLLLAGGLYLLWWRPRSARMATARKRRLRARPGDVETGPRFCHECGGVVQPGDLFCRRCGAELRRGG